MDKHTELTIEQQFSIASFQQQVTNMSHEQTQKMLVELYRNMIVQETIFKDLIKKKWNISTPLVDQLG
jgi:hypothetical protein